MYAFKTLNITVQAKRSALVPSNWLVQWPHGEIEIRTNQQFRWVFHPADAEARAYLARESYESEGDALLASRAEKLSVE